VPKSKVFLASAVLFTLVTSACSAARSTEPTTTFGTVAGVAPTLPTLPPDSTTPGQSTPLSPALSSVDTSTTTTTSTPSTVSTSTSSSSSTTDWEVVGGIFTTKAAAQSQIDKLTAANFTGFSLKAVGAKTAAVLPGLTKADATAMSAKINKAGVATATTFHLTSSTTSTTTTTTVPDATATNYEVVDGIFTTKADAQAKIDKLTAAKFTKFTIKPIPGEFAVVKAGLTKAEATDLMTKINAANLGPARIKAL
jgi:cell division septation protein DedD